jgi:hypothetical protein
MMWRKLLMSGIIAIVVVFNTIGFGWSVIEGDGTSTASYAINGLYTVYLLAMVATSVRQTAADVHSEAVIHLTALSTMATLLLSATTIIPADRAPVTSSVDSLPALKGLWITSLVFYWIFTIMAYTTARAPTFHYDPQDIYSEKIVRARTNMDHENVSGNIGMSPDPDPSTHLTVFHLS